jgi:hypothetical protein
MSKIDGRQRLTRQTIVHFTGRFLLWSLAAVGLVLILLMSLSAARPAGTLNLKVEATYSAEWAEPMWQEGGSVKGSATVPARPRR